MSKAYEKCISANILNFKKMHSECVKLGENYSPSEAELKIERLNSIYMECATYESKILADVTTLLIPHNERVMLFKCMNRLVNRIVIYVNGTNESSAFKKRIELLGFKILAYVRNKPGMETEDPDFDADPPPLSLFVNHQSYLKKTQAFFEIIELLSDSPHYKPDKTELQIHNLTRHANRIKETNEAADTLLKRINLNRVKRDEVVYKNEDSLYNIQKSCKRYVVKLFGEGSAKSRKITNLKFTKKSNIHLFYYQIQ